MADVNIQIIYRHNRTTVYPRYLTPSGQICSKFNKRSTSQVYELISWPSYAGSESVFFIYWIQKTLLIEYINSFDSIQKVLGQYQNDLYHRPQIFAWPFRILRRLHWYYPHLGTCAPERRRHNLPQNTFPLVPVEQENSPSKTPSWWKHLLSDHDMS